MPILSSLHRKETKVQGDGVRTQSFPARRSWSKDLSPVCGIRSFPCCKCSPAILSTLLIFWEFSRKNSPQPPGVLGFWFLLAERVSEIYFSHLEFSPQSDSTLRLCQAGKWLQPPWGNPVGGITRKSGSCACSQHGTGWRQPWAEEGAMYAIGVQPLSKFMDQEEAPPIGEREQEMERGRRVLPGEWGGVPINTPSLSVLWTHWSSSWSLRITGCDQPLKGRKQHFIQEATLPKLTIHPLWVFHEPVLLVWTFLKMLWNGSKERIISINSWAKTPSLFF